MNTPTDWSGSGGLSPRFSGDFGWHGLDETARRLKAYEEAFERMSPEEQREELACGELQRARRVVRYMALRGEYL